MILSGNGQLWQFSRIECWQVHQNGSDYSDSSVTNDHAIAAIGTKSFGLKDLIADRFLGRKFDALMQSKNNGSLGSGRVCDSLHWIVCRKDS